MGFTGYTKVSARLQSFGQETPSFLLQLLPAACLPGVWAPFSLFRAGRLASSGLSLTLIFPLPSYTSGTLLTTLGPPGYSKRISPSQDPLLNHTCQVLLPGKATYIHRIQPFRYGYLGEGGSVFCPPHWSWSRAWPLG